MARGWRPASSPRRPTVGLFLRIRALSVAPVRPAMARNSCRNPLVVRDSGPRRARLPARPAVRSRYGRRLQPPELLSARWGQVRGLSDPQILRLAGYDARPAGAGVSSGFRIAGHRHWGLTLAITRGPRSASDAGPRRIPRRTYPRTPRRSGRDRLSMGLADDILREGERSGWRSSRSQRTRSPVNPRSLAGQLAADLRRTLADLSRLARLPSD